MRSGRARCPPLGRLSFNTRQPATRTAARPSLSAQPPQGSSAAKRPLTPPKAARPHPQTARRPRLVAPAVNRAAGALLVASSVYLVLYWLPSLGSGGAGFSDSWAPPRHPPAVGRPRHLLLRPHVRLCGDSRGARDCGARPDWCRSRAAASPARRVAELLHHRGREAVFRNDRPAAVERLTPVLCSLPSAIR